MRTEVSPASLALDVGDSARILTKVWAGAAPVDSGVIFFSSNRRAVSVSPAGVVRAMSPGRFTLYVLGGMPGPNGMPAARVEVPVTVRWPAVARVSVSGAPDRFYAGTTVRQRAVVTDASGATRDNVPVGWRSSNERVVRIDRFGDATAVAPGPATITAVAGGVTQTQRVTVVASPARSVRLTLSATDVRTGDVVHATAAALDAAGREIGGFPVTYSVKADVEDTVIAPGPAATIDARGRFVADRAGSFTVIANAGSLAARRTVAVSHRYVTRKIPDAFSGVTDSSGGKATQGAVREKHSSDIWVWSGRDGRDYAITGTWSADGTAYFWDVTDPSHPVKADSVQVDARTVNDVKVDEARGLCFLTREGASNRRNGLVVVDCSNPRKVSILSRFDDGLYGGVHNIFYWNKRLFPINAGTRFDIINLEDPAKPYREGFFELDTPGHGIHDVWVVDGIAYASQWEDGMIMVDVGNGKYGGTPAKPVLVSSYKYPIGATHSAFPYQNRKTGKFYVFIGDEQFPYGLNPDRPEEAGGYIHIVDFTDVKKPEEVARYQIPEAGPHNFWIENDTMYVAYYNAGLRVVDVSGELMGNLYAQGRELARFQARDPNGKVANAPMAWGPQPHKGRVFFSDFNSGLWAVKLPERQTILTP